MPDPRDCPHDTKDSPFNHSFKKIGFFNLILFCTEMINLRKSFARLTNSPAMSVLLFSKLSQSLSLLYLPLSQVHLLPSGNGCIRGRTHLPPHTSLGPSGDAKGKEKCEMLPQPSQAAQKQKIYCSLWARASMGSLSGTWSLETLLCLYTSLHRKA